LQFEKKCPKNVIFWEILTEKQRNEAVNVILTISFSNNMSEMDAVHTSWWCQFCCTSAGKTALGIFFKLQ